MLNLSRKELNVTAKMRGLKATKVCLKIDY